MHPEAFAFVQKTVEMYGPFTSVLDVGGRNINGSVRGLFPAATRYVSVDVVAGPEVDVVADAADPYLQTDAGPELFKCVVFCEIFEHARRWREVLKQGARHLDSDGVLIATTAGPARAPHGAQGEARVADNEWYENIDPSDIYNVLRGIGFGVYSVETGPSQGGNYAHNSDVYAYAWW